MIKTNSIKSKDDLVAFLKLLNKEYKENGDSWENGTLPDFLEALTSWAEDMDGYYANLGLASEIDLEQNSALWRVFADMLMAARVYE